MLTIILLVIFLSVIILFSLILSEKIVIRSKFAHKKNTRKKGIVFFDIDDTLSTIPKEENHKIIKHCIDSNYDIGIVTASKRPINFVCNNYTPSNISRWAPSILCNKLQENNFKTFNSLVVTSGQPYYILNEAYKYDKDKYIYGKLKGLQILKTIQQMNIENLKNYDVILVDDQLDVLEGAKQVAPFIRQIHVNNNNIKNRLSIKLLNLYN